MKASGCSASVVSPRTLLVLAAAVTSFGLACTPNFDALRAGLGASEGGAAGSSAGGGGGDCSSHGCGEAGADSAGAAGDSEGLAGAHAMGGGGNVAGRAGSSGGAAGSSVTAGAGGSSVTAGSGGSGGAAAVDPPLVGTASADSSQHTFAIHLPKDANDGDLLTRWVADDGSLNHWWQLDLGQSHALSRIEMVWEYPAQAAGQPYDYTVGVSDSACPTDFSTTPPVVIDKTANTETTQLQVAQFPADTMGQCVRITVTGLPPVVNQMASWASFWEVRVYGQ